MATGQGRTDRQARSGVNDDTLRGFLGYTLKRCFNVVQADLARTLRPFELRMLTYTALVLVVDNPGLRQSQLAATMDVERPNMVAIVDELEALGLVVRTQSRDDRRAYAIQPTPDGRARCRQAIAAVVAHETALFAHLDRDRRRAVRAALEQTYRTDAGGLT